MRIVECRQGSPEWFRNRRGLITAGSFDRILTPKTLKYAAGAKSYIAQLVADVLDPSYPRVDEYVSKAMADGLDCEPEARAWFSLETGLDVREVGMCITDDGRFECSPDGLISDDSGLELKVPETKTHVAYLLSGELPDEYRLQVQGGMFVTNRPTWHFVSYNLHLTPLHIVVQRDEEVMEALAEALDRFYNEYQTALRRIREMSGIDTPIPLPAGAPEDSTEAELFGVPQE